MDGNAPWEGQLLVPLIAAALFACVIANPTAQRTLESADCHVLAEGTDVANPATVWIGLVTDISRRPLREKSVDLARRELTTVGRGLPPATRGQARRPIAFISCDSAKPIGPTMQHLVRDAQVPVVIGPEYSGEVLETLHDYTIPARTALLTVASATALSGVPARGLFFRTSVHDGFQATVQARLITDVLEPQLRDAATVPPGVPMKLFLAYKGDTYGRALADAVATKVHVTARSEYGNRDDPSVRNLDATYAATARQILASYPHVIVLVGTTEAEQIISTVERGWPPSGRPRPRWVVSEAVQSVLSRIEAWDTTFAERVLATAPRINFDSPIAREWRTALSRAYPAVFAKDRRSGNALALYDLAYATAFAVTEMGSRPLNGLNIAAALRTLNATGAPDVPVGPGAILRAFNRLTQGRPVNIRGGSGNLDWDANGDVLQDIDVLCLVANAGAASGSGLQPSGLYFDVRHSRFVGRMTACRSHH
jgi:ABC-type branched-subunit amino acid transport system substrate-binding protein